MVCGIKQVILLIITSNLCRFLCWEPTEYKQALKHLQLLKDINSRNYVGSVYHDSEFDFFLCSDFVLSISRRTFQKMFLSLNANVEIYMLIIDNFDFAVLAGDFFMSRPVSHHFTCDLAVCIWNWYRGILNVRCFFFR